MEYTLDTSKATEVSDNLLTQKVGNTLIIVVPDVTKVSPPAPDKKLSQIAQSHGFQNIFGLSMNFFLGKR